MPTLNRLKLWGLKFIGREQILHVRMSDEQLQTARNNYQLTKDLEGLGQLYAHVRTCPDPNCSICNEPQALPEQEQTLQKGAI